MPLSGTFGRFDDEIEMVELEGSPEFKVDIFQIQVDKVVFPDGHSIITWHLDAWTAFKFDLGRYADILLNVFLVILIFYFPGGYIGTLFLPLPSPTPSSTALITIASSTPCLTSRL